jgi:peroxiredoxin
MNERNDQLSGLAQVLDRPVDPRPEFADALLDGLLEELAQTDGAPAGHGSSWSRRALPAPVRRPLLAGVLALAVAALAIAAVVVSRPSPASALEVIRQARAAFAHLPPFQATYKVALNPDGTGPRYVKKGATATVTVSYGGPHRLRTHILAEHGYTSVLSTGSYQIENGHSSGVYDAKRKHFVSDYVSDDYLSWNGAHPDWQRVCRGPNSKVLADTHVAGRDARHIRCSYFTGQTWQLWIDRQTGLLLKVVGQIGEDGFFLGGDIGTSATGGFKIQKLRYNPTFPNRTFSFPPGAFDAGAVRQATLAKLPPFRAVIAVNDGRRLGSYVDEGWWLNEHTWRIKTLVEHPRGKRGNDANDSRYGGFTGAGSFSVMAHGTEMVYAAHDHIFSRNVDDEQDAGPVDGLLEYLDNIDYSPARCPIVGHERIAGRETDHRRCGNNELLIDSATGVALREQVNGHDVLVVRSIEYHPHFPAGIFRFVPPRGSRNLQRLEANPYYKTKLAPGKPAPNWHATTLAGKPFQLTDLRGKPTLVALLADWCPPCINNLAPLEQAHQHSNGATTVIWVDAQGEAQEAKKVARFNHLTVPGVVDKGAVEKAWGGGSVPMWILLDSRGRVIKARLGPQSVAQLKQLLASG